MLKPKEDAGTGTLRAGFAGIVDHEKSLESLNTRQKFLLRL